MGYSERNCIICGSRFNMARLRRINEPLNMAWDKTRDHWRPGIDPNGDEDEPSPEQLVPRIINGDIVGYDCDGEFHGFFVEATGIKSGSACDKAGCSEEAGDHACGGPSCDTLQESYFSSGYNGWLIDVEEMKIMTCVQAAMPNENPDDWEPESDDDEFEHRNLILTAVSESAPDEFEITHVPYRHGVGGKFLISDFDSDLDWAVPFHGPCYQVLKRRAKGFESTINLQLLDGLIDLRDSEIETSSASEDVKENDDQMWVHVPGTEYLAADPYNIPGLIKVLQDCIRKDSVAPDVYVETLRANQRVVDPFANLTPELRLLILDLLDYKDVAALRLVSRMFRVLPQKFFRKMICDRMPWIWEIDDALVSNDRIDWFKFWSRLSQADGGKGKGKKGLSLKLEEPQLGRGARVNGLVNRRRIWFEAGQLLEKMDAASWVT